MDSLNLRYQFNPTLTDTVGFFDFCIPLTNERSHPAADSLKKYYDYSVFDYITPPPDSKDLTQTTSAFAHHLLKPIHHGSLPVSRQSTDWITLVLLICLFIFAWIQTYYSKRFGQIFRAVAQSHHVNQMEREGNLFSERITLGLGFVYYAISTIFIFQFFNKYLTIPAGLNNVIFAGIIFGSLFAYQMLKSALVYILGIIFFTSESSRAFQLNTLIFNHIIGALLLPVTIMALYWDSQVFLNIGLIIISLLLLYRLYRGILTGLSNKNYNLFYLFLYLCTLEILPLLLVYKVIIKTSDWTF
jgi:hypothetical protein